MELYHLLNARRRQTKNYPLDNQDQARFVHDLYEFNDSASATNTVRGLPPDSPEKAIMFDLVGRTSERGPNRRHTRVVHHGKSLPLTGIRKSLTVELPIHHEIECRLCKVFQRAVQRVGTLFQGRTKKIHINSDGHFLQAFSTIFILTPSTF